MNNQSSYAYTYFLAQLRIRYGLDISDVGPVELETIEDAERTLNYLEEKYTLIPN